MRGAGADGLEVAMKPGNAGGAKGPDISALGRSQPAMGGTVAHGKAYVIPKQLVWEAYQRVKANRGAAGVDGQSLAAFEKCPASAGRRLPDSRVSYRQGVRDDEGTHASIT
jgi:hypothetical protein